MLAQSCAELHCPPPDFCIASLVPQSIMIPEGRLVETNSLKMVVLTAGTLDGLNPPLRRQLPTSLRRVRAVFYL